MQLVQLPYVCLNDENMDWDRLQDKSNPKVLSDLIQFAYFNFELFTDIVIAKVNMNIDGKIHELTQVNFAVDDFMIIGLNIEHFVNLLSTLSREARATYFECVTTYGDIPIIKQLIQDVWLEKPENEKAVVIDFNPEFKDINMEVIQSVYMSTYTQVYTTKDMTNVLEFLNDHVVEETSATANKFVETLVKLSKRYKEEAEVGRDELRKLEAHAIEKFVEDFLVKINSK